ncbi:MAG TPA: ATP synthase F0 subunit B [Geobacteraceae bacterium]
MINLDLAFVIQLVNFLVLILVLNIFLYKPIRKVLADRQGELAAAKARAEGVDREVQEKMAQYEARLREMKSKASDERAVLVKEAQAEEAALLEKARKEAADTLATIKDKVAKEAADARALLQEKAKVLSVDICEKVLGRSL